MAEENAALRGDVESLRGRLEVAQGVAAETRARQEDAVAENERLTKYLTDMKADRMVVGLLERMGAEALTLRHTTPAPPRAILERAMLDVREAALDALQLCGTYVSANPAMGRTLHEKVVVFRERMDRLEKDVREMENELLGAAVREKSYITRLCT